MKAPKDWTGNAYSTYAALGASNHTDAERQQHDYYATEPKATEVLLAVEKFNPLVWECACGEGHMSRVLEAHGYRVISTDLYPRGYGSEEPLDFLSDKITYFTGDIVTNPPYKYAVEFARKAIDIVRPGAKVAMFLKIQFLEGKKRRKFFEENPPRVVYVSTSRLRCAKNGIFNRKRSSAICYAWFVWKKGYRGNPIIRWIN